jgi:tetratricopeptide (TPR) repeat protein
LSRLFRWFADLLSLSGWFGHGSAKLRHPLARDSHDDEAKISLADQLAQEDRHTESIRVLEELLAVDSGNVPALVLLSAVLVADGQADAALAAAERAVEADARDPLAHVALGWAYLRRNDAEAAFASANQALRLNRRSVDALAVRGAALSALGSHRAAVETFAEVERTDPAFLDRNHQFARYVSASQAVHAVGLMEFNP